MVKATKESFTEVKDMERASTVIQQEVSSSKASGFRILLLEKNDFLCINI
jgi:hypothetical protein